MLATFVVYSERAAAAPFAAVVMDARNGEILHSVNDRTRLHPASLTKMMTLYIAFEAVQRGEISLDTQVTISRRAASEVPSKLGLRPGQRISLRYLIRGAALRSGNDTATAIAEAISGSVEAFAARMTRTAAAMGMTQTTFRNAHGLTENGHLSSARDMAIMARQLYFDYPQYYNLFSRRTEDAGIARVRNTNWRFLDGYRGADGIKTGYTRAAGYNLAASAERGGTRIIVVVFGGRSTIDRHNRIVELMDRGFRQAPSRVAVRRPAPPDYTNTRPVAVADASAGSAARRNLAPTRSPTPQRRPDPSVPDVPDALIASLQSGISEALTAAAAPEAAADPAQGSAAEAVSPPPPRPEAPETALAALEIEAAPDAAEAAGFRVIDADRYAALTADVAVPEDALPSDSDSALDDAPEAEEALAAVTPEPRPVELVATSEDAASESDAREETAQPTDMIAATTEAPVEIVAALAPEIEEAPPTSEVAGATILWRDEAPLAEVAARAATVTEGLILLTTTEQADTPDATQIAGRAALPEVVTRVSTSGGRIWSIDLGLHPSRYDAERVAIRAALAETAILSTGLRRVNQRAGRFVAGIHSLTEEEAEIACLRLSARGQACEVIHP
nr:D-alanyl-D-alanine carboxypeptidase family protein [Pararhodobacter sp. SW119]